MDGLDVEEATSDAVEEEIIIKVEMEMNTLGLGGGVGGGGGDGVDGGRNLARVRVWSKWENGKREYVGKGKPNKREAGKNRGKFWGKFKGL